MQSKKQLVIVVPRVSVSEYAYGTFDSKNWDGIEHLTPIKISQT